MDPDKGEQKDKNLFELSFIDFGDQPAIPAGAPVRATLRPICAYGASGSGKLEDYGPIISSV